MGDVLFGAFAGLVRGLILGMFVILFGMAFAQPLTPFLWVGAAVVAISTGFGAFQGYNL